MFGKRKEETKTIGKIETVIGPDSSVKGSVFSKGSIRIDGLVDGGVSQADAVIVGETGTVNGDINAQMLIVGGKVAGNVQVTASLDLLESGELKGDIKTPQLSIHDGAFFEGNCTMIKKEPAFQELQKEMEV